MLELHETPAEPDNAIAGGDLLAASKNLLWDARESRRNGDEARARRFEGAARHLSEAAAWLAGQRD